MNGSQDSWLVSIGMAFAWLVTSLIALIDGLYIREAVLSIAGLVQLETYRVFRENGGIGLDFSAGYMVSVLDNVVLLTLGIGMIVAVIAIEYYFRKGRPKGLLLKRIGKVLAFEFAIIVVSIIIRLVV